VLRENCDRENCDLGELTISHRVDYMERSPMITYLFHARILGILSLLAAVDSYFVSNAYFVTLQRGASVQIVFGFEVF
jgi:E3 ubiquitin-protein ligase synoviolin